MKIIIIMTLVLLTSCLSEDNDSTEKMSVLIKNSKDFDNVVTKAKFSPSEAENLVLDYLLSSDLSRDGAICGPVVAVLDGNYLLSVPDKFGKFYLNGYLVNYTTGDITKLEETSGVTYKIKGQFRPTVSKRR